MATQELVRYSSIQNYPFLTAEEFELACHCLDNRYIRALLGPARKDFKLRIHSSMAAEAPYVVITAPIAIEDDVDAVLNFGALSAGDEAHAMDVEAEDADVVVACLPICLSHALIRIPGSTPSRPGIWLGRRPIRPI